VREELPRPEALRAPLLAEELRDRLDVPPEEREAVERDDGRLVPRLDPLDRPADLEPDDEPADRLRPSPPLAERPLVERPLAERPVVERPPAERPLAERSLVERLPVALRPVPRPLVDRVLVDRLLSERLLVPRAAVDVLRRVADLLRPRG
jgi:hypothetical protein